MSADSPQLRGFAGYALPTIAEIKAHDQNGHSFMMEPRISRVSSRGLSSIHIPGTSDVDLDNLDLNESDDGDNVDTDADLDGDLDGDAGAPLNGSVLNQIHPNGSEHDGHHDEHDEDEQKAINMDHRRESKGMKSPLSPNTGAVEMAPWTPGYTTTVSLAKDEFVVGTPSSMQLSPNHREGLRAILEKSKSNSVLITPPPATPNSMNSMQPSQSAASQ